jgi:N-acetylmuramoyl-L-alanine amidase
MQVFAKGDRGNEVVDIQVKLSALGYDLGVDGADGSYGDVTAGAVKDFQESRDLPVTGAVDGETWRALVEATYELGDRLLYLKTPYFRGDDVRELQLDLNTLGFNTGSVDGIFGYSTERAVREFQQNFGLTRDGIFGPSMLAAFRDLSHLLSGKASRVFPDPRRDQSSAISVFRDVKIAVALNSVDKSTIFDSDNDVLVDVVHDLGMRLGNLLELLGAEVAFRSDNLSIDEKSTFEVFVMFELNYSGDSTVKGSTVCYANEAEEVQNKSRALAESVQRELVQSLNSDDHGISVCSINSEPVKAESAIIVKPLYMTSSHERGLLSAEIFRQKIAVAVFDGISDYLRLCVNRNA